MTDLSPPMSIAEEHIVNKLRHEVKRAVNSLLIVDSLEKSEEYRLLCKRIGQRIKFCINEDIDEWIRDVTDDFSG